MLLAELVATSRNLQQTSGRKEKTALLADALRAMSADELDVGVRYLAGQVRQPRLDIGWRGVGAVEPPPRSEPELTLLDVDGHLQDVADQGGEGSTQARRDIVGNLLHRATEDEQWFLRALIVGEMRHGALEGEVLAAIAAAASVPLADVQRAQMFAADLGAVATAALHGGRQALRGFSLRVGHPVQPMLAASADDPSDVVEEVGEVVVDHKLDGVRVQIHRAGSEVAVYSRNLNDLTGRMVEAVALARSLPVDRVVLDGEVLAIGEGDRPAAFQTTMSAVGRDGVRATSAGAVHPFVFDVLHADGEDLIDQPLRRRLEVLDALLPEANRIPRVRTDDPAQARDWFLDAVAAGQEGVVVKDPSSPYAAGRRGKAWRKVKPVHTLDLVVLAIEWGSGRRRGKLSNIHLGARDPSGAVTGVAGGFVMLGKTFKGMTDEMLEWQTQRFLGLEVGRDGHVVHVEPVQVVEVAFDGIQASPRYPGGVALRFARVVRYRDDRDAGDADTIDTVLAIHRGDVRPRPKGG